MRQDARLRFVLAMAGGLLLAQSLMAAEGANGNLVGVRWLESHRNSVDVLILDASPTQLYAAGHIPGAIGVDVFALLSFGLQEMPVAAAEQLYQSAGISPGKKIVLSAPTASPG